MIKRIIPVVILGLLLASIGWLGWYSFADQLRGWQWRNPANDKIESRLYRQVQSLELGDISPHSYQSYSFTRGLLAFSPDGRHLAVATEQGQLLLLQADGQVAWRKHIGASPITALVFTPDSQTVLLGESSSDGYIYSLATADGQERWRYAVSRELGGSLADKEWPAVLSLSTDAHGAVYAAAQKSMRQADGRNRYLSRIYRVNADGRDVRRFPADHNMDAALSWVRASAAGETAVFGTANWSVSQPLQYSQTVYCVQPQQGELLWSAVIPAVPPYQQTTLRNSPALRADGKLTAVLTGDSRAVVYDEQGQLAWQRTLSQPQEIQGAYLNAVGLYADVSGSYVVFATGNTYNRANWRLPTPVEDPNSNTVFVFSESGDLVRRQTLGAVGTLEQLAVAGDYAYAAIGRNLKTKDPTTHGVYILPLAGNGAVDRLALSGPCIGVTATADGQRLAALEAPLSLENGALVGRYRLVLFSKKTEEADGYVR